MYVYIIDNKEEEGTWDRVADGRQAGAGADDRDERVARPAICGPHSPETPPCKQRLPASDIYSFLNHIYIYIYI